MYSLPSEQEPCTSLPEDIRVSNVNFNTVRWSPDGTKIAFSENFLTTNTDSDIWVFDTISHTYTDLTPAPNRELTILGNEDPNITFTMDIIPQWSADSHSVYFIRYMFHQPSDANAEFYRVDVTGGEPEKIGYTVFEVSRPMFKIYSQVSTPLT